MFMNIVLIFKNGSNFNLRSCLRRVKYKLQKFNINWLIYIWNWNEYVYILHTQPKSFNCEKKKFLQTQSKTLNWFEIVTTSENKIWAKKIKGYFCSIDIIYNIQYK